MDFEKLTPETKLAYKVEKERKKKYVQRSQKVKLISKNSIFTVLLWWDGCELKTSLRIYYKVVQDLNFFSFLLSLPNSTMKHTVHCRGS